MDALIPMLVFVAVVVVIITAIVTVIVLIVRYARKVKRERTLGLKSSAAFLGWQFAEEAALNYLPNLDNFALFSQGHSKQITNLMYGEPNGIKTALFDYVYTTGHGKNQSTYSQSVVYFEPRNLNIPFFSLRPENFIHKFIAALGYQDIDFGNRPTFSSQYLLRGNEEQAIRNTFNDEVIAFYEANQGTCTDGGGNQLFIFRQGFRTPPHEAQSFVDWASRLQDLFGLFSRRVTSGRC